MMDELLVSLLPRLRACVSCGKCLADCPVYRDSGREEDTPRAKLNILKWYLASGGHPGPASAELFFRCTLCLKCQTGCPAGVPLGEILEQTRQALAAPASQRNPAGRLRRIMAAPCMPASSPAPFSPPPAEDRLISGGSTGKPDTAVLMLVSSRMLLEAKDSLRRFRDGWQAAEGKPFTILEWPGISLFRQFWSGDLNGMFRQIRQRDRELDPGQELVLLEPEMAWCWRLAARMEDGPVAADCPPRPVRDYLDGLSAMAGRLESPGDPFMVVPPPVPLSSDDLQIWNRRWETLRIPGWRPFPENWRPWRGEGLFGFYPDTARHLASRLLEAIAAAGIRQLLLSSDRSRDWLRLSPAAASWRLNSWLVLTGTGPAQGRE